MFQLTLTTKIKDAFLGPVWCCLLVAAAVIVALLGMVLVPPVTVLFIGNVLIAAWQQRGTHYPHRSGAVLYVVLTVLAAVGSVFMLIYSFVGFYLSLNYSSFAAFFGVLLLLLFFICFPNQRQQVNEIFEWAYFSFDRRIVAIVSGFFHGTQEAAASSRQVVITWLVWLVLVFLAAIPIVVLITSIVVLCNFKSVETTSDHLLISLTALPVVFAVLLFLRAIIRFIKTPKVGSGNSRIQSFKLPGNAALVGDHRIAHLSDLHIPHDGRLTEKAEWRPNFLDRCVVALDKTHNVRPLGAVVFSGDVTDTGHELAWRSFVSKFARYKERSILSPGNHDLNIVGYGVPSIFLVADEQHMGGRWKRLCNYMEVASEVMGKRAHVWSESGLSPLVGAWGKVKKNAEKNDIRQFQDAVALFPFVVSVPEMGEHVKFIVWNTVRSSVLALNNSYGNVGEKQFANFKAIVRHFAGEGEQVSYIHVMHHKLGFPATPLLRHNNNNNDADSACGLVTDVFRALKHRAQIAGMVMLNAGSTMNIVADGGSSVVLHGHHHASFWGKIEHQGKTMHVVSAPSTTLGTEMSESGSPVGLGFDVLEITTTAGSCALVAPPRRIMI